MSNTYHNPDAARTVVAAPQHEQHTGSTAGSGHASGRELSAPLQTMASGILGGASPLRFMDSINAGSRQLGNRTFLHWVESLHTARQGRGTQENATQGLQGPNHPPAATAPMQFGPKKHGRKEKAAPGLQPEAEPQPGAGAAPEPGETLPGAESVSASRPAAGKKKKKSRVQVALNTLRADGVEAFARYIESGIGEAELLRTLTERINRAEDLREKRAAALAAVEQRMRMLDPEAVPARVQPRTSAAGEVAEKADCAPLIRSMNWKLAEIFKCCVKGDAGRLRRLLMYGEVNLNGRFLDATPLTLAVFKGHTAVVRELLPARGIDVDLAQFEGGTALYIAAQQGHVDIVKLMLEDGRANVNLATLAGTTPLCIAVQHGNEEVVRLLLERPEIKVDAYQSDGATPLFCASQDGCPGIVALLLSRGANVNLALDDGTTPLYAAIKQGNTDVCRMLIRVPGVEIERYTESGATALTVACMAGNREIVRLLLRKKADPNLPTKLGAAPLHLAAIHGHTAIVDLLLNAGADMDAEVLTGEQDKYTPYRIALLAGNREIASLLSTRRRSATEQPGAPGRLSLQDKPAQPTPPATTAPSSAAQTTGRSSQSGETTAVAAAPVEESGQPMPEETPGPLRPAKQALRDEVLGKLANETLDTGVGIKLLEAVNATADIDGLCSLYNRLAHIERQKERARPRRRRGKGLPVMSRRDPDAADTPDFTLGRKTGLDANAVEGEIKAHLAPAYHRFVSQAVNDMEFGRGKPTSGYPGLLHASAGIPGVGSCSVFYYPDAERNRIRVVGTGHHLDRGTYQLDYAADELRGCRTLRLS